MSDNTTEQNWTENDIAIVGMAAHLPGADTLEQYWHNLRDGVESIEVIPEKELQGAGESLRRLKHKNYVPAAAALKDFEKFDAEFFGLSPKEAAIMDPQHRQFLEVSWEALETAGHMPERFPGQIGVFAGCGMGSYFYFNICSNPDLVDSTGMFLLRHTGNDKDFLSTRLSHILDLKGPSLSVQTACSTSLVAAHYACQSLLNGECDMALAGGVTIELPQRRGYIYEEGEILSPDGHCHAFDHRAQGTVFGSGAGVVVLRRLADALADGDHIWAVIRGTAVNNDGAAKAGYLAPSVDGQAAAIAEAHGMADLRADTIDYVECHGTGTYLGDPIEVAALTEAFRATTEDNGFCKIGSVKTNIGHLDTAAGAASLIKTALSLHHQQIPPSLGYETPNPAIDFETSPFKVNDRLSDWNSHKGPRRAGVNSLGVGGTNAHLVLEEAPKPPLSDQSDWPFQLLTVSGRTSKALEANAAALAAHLRAHPEQALADIAYTLQMGRRGFEKRRVLVAQTHEEAADLLESNDTRRVFTHTAESAEPKPVFMFPGGGAQYVRMGQDLYETEPVFREWMDLGLDILQAKVSEDIRALWRADGVFETSAERRLKQPSLQLPLIMIVEYALAQLWMSWGVQPQALVGHSMGENTAASLAGVMSFEECIGLVLLRGQLFDTVEAGGMLSVALSRQETQALIGDDLDIAAENASELTVVSGPVHALDALQERLSKQDIDAQRIAIDIAAHSRMLAPILDDFRAYLHQIDLQPPRVPILSNRSGKILTDAEATDPEYWVAHLRGTVNFARCIETLAADRDHIFIEVGPGKALSSLARMHKQVSAGKVLSSLRHPEEDIEDDLFFIGALGRYWACGGTFDWAQIWGDAQRQKVVLPTYAFQRSPYYIAPGRASAEPAEELIRQEDMRDWGYRRCWRPAAAQYDPENLADPGLGAQCSWLLFMDETGTGDLLAKRLRTAGHFVVEVHRGDGFSKLSEDSYTLAPERGREGYDQLLADLIAHGKAPDRILHLWLLTAAETFRPGSSFFHRNLEMGFYSLFFLGQALVEENLPKPLHIKVVTNGAAALQPGELIYPEKATIRGPQGVLPREIPGLTCAWLDVELSDRLADQLMDDLISTPDSAQVIYRGTKRFERSIKSETLPQNPISWGPGQVFLITGGFGGIGLTIARDMLKAGAHVVLQSREALPPRSEWAKLTQFRSRNDKIARRIDAIQKLETLGGRLLVVAADVCNLSEMRDAKDLILDAFGNLTGVIHAAGVIDDAPMLSKTSSEIDDVLAPKLHGTMVLDQLFEDGELDWIALFGSTSTVTTPTGQIDYVAANEFLNAYAVSREGQQTHVKAINWGIWSDVGMAAESLEAASGAKPMLQQTLLDVPVLETVETAPDGTLYFETELSSKRSWMLDQHRTADGTAILPGTGYLELISEAMQALDGTRAYEVQDLIFLRAFHLADQETRKLRLKFKPDEAGYSIEVQGDWKGGYVTHAEARVSMVCLPEPKQYDLAALQDRFGDMICAPEGGHLKSPQEAHLKFGPEWRVLRARVLGDGAGLAFLTLPERSEASGMALHPGLLDLGTGWAMNLIEGYRAENLWVPVSYGALRHYAALPDSVTSWIKLTGGTAQEGSACFDIVLMDDAGRTCVEVQGLTLKRLETGFEQDAIPDPAPHEIETSDHQAKPQPVAAEQQRLLQNLEQGIPALDGAGALRHALASHRSSLVVSSMDLNALLLQVSQEAAQLEEAQHGFERPDLEADFVAPANDIERTLAGFWQELLGIEAVGTQDSFFDLGGHSLVAVRLFSMVKKAYRLEFPISVLFEAPTIAKCAALIEERIGPQDRAVAGAGSDQVQQLPQRRYTHLVPMHSAANSPKTPFFLVAGMFGNVLNLRHLAHLIGSDRPFYGLQARGLFGDVAPHDNLDEAARDYISEMQQVQPHGPYLLGGFSGGGITAYEIARQLEAMGETVSLLVMLDTPLPQRRPLTRGDRIDIQLQEIRDGGFGYLWRWARNRILWEFEKRKRPERTQGASDAQFHDVEIEASFLAAIAGYKVASWQGRVALYRPPLVGKWQVGPDRWIDKDRAYVFHDNDWGQYLSNLTVQEVPGDHDSMVLEPNVRVLAAHIRKEIDTAETSAQVVIPFRKAAV